MADNEKPATPVKGSSNGPPESPTTARPLDFDDDAQEAGHPTPSEMETSITKIQPAATEPAAPPKPPRPLNAREQAELTLREAFPSIEASVVRAVLTASSGRVEPAFNALLEMTDPDAAKDLATPPMPPAKPPRPTHQPTTPTTTAQSQLEADELYARQLHEHYSSSALPRQRAQPQRQPPQQPRQSSFGWGTRSQSVPQKGLKPPEGERSFIDDDLPVIRDNIRKGFLETQSTVNKWVSNLRKKIDGDDQDDISSQPAEPGTGFAPRTQSYGKPSSEMSSRRSADQERYDADPELIGDDFTRLEMRDTENEPPKKPNRPLANPDLFRSTPPASNRKVSFQDGPPEEIQWPKIATPPIAATSTSTSSKWQPLSAVEPSPVADHDPFSLGDSDDDKDAKSKDGKEAEAERIPKATAEATSPDMRSDSMTSMSKP